MSRTDTTVICEYCGTIYLKADPFSGAAFSHWCKEGHEVWLKKISPAQNDTTDKRFVVRDDNGECVETFICGSREEAIRRFCYPALMWPPYEASGWTCKEETP